jgi:hypothetical protein
VRRTLAALAAAAALLPAAAWACPACATRSGYGAATAALIAGLIAAPYAVVAVALKIIRRLGEDRP